MSGYSLSPTGFASNLQIALAVSADTDLMRSRDAWRIFDGRSVKPNYAEHPNFALEPRRP